MKRIRYLDIIKGFAILIVIIGHYYSPSIVKTIIWSFHMPLFVIVSGYFIKDDFSLVRIKKLLKSYIVPYLIVWMINLIFIEFKLIIQKKGIDESLTFFGKYLLSALWACGSNDMVNVPSYITKVGVIWFLAAMFWGQLIFRFFLSLLKNDYLVLTTILILWTISFLLTQNLNPPLGIANGIAFLPYLFIGYIYKTKLSNGRIISNYISVFLMLILWIFTIVIDYKLNLTFNIVDFNLFNYNYGLEILASIGASLVVILFFKKLSQYFKLNIFTYIGNISLIVLCVHGIDIEVFDGVWFKLLEKLTLFLKNEIITNLIVLAIRLMIIVFLSVIIFELKKKIRRHGIDKNS